jgi:uncharacterized membrane protein YqiK
MEIGIIIGVIAVALIALLFASYIKAPTDKALIVSGLRKKHPNKQKKRRDISTNLLLVQNLFFLF